MTVEFLIGDCTQTLAGLAEGRFHTCVTSPPYWGLRSYGTPDLDWPAISYAPLAGLPPCVHVPAMKASLGLEPTIEAFIGHMVLVFREVRRVLRDDGTLWLNMGDSYAGSRRGGDSGASTMHSPQPDHSRIPRNDVRIPGLKPKDLVGQPWRLALALQADGWWLRSDVIWHKPNPMPESTKDRPTKAHEYVFLLAKNERYYYDADAIKEPTSENTNARTSVAGWARGPGSHDTIAHNQEQEGRNGRKLLTEDRRPKAWKQDMGSNRTLVDGYERKDYPAPAPLKNPKAAPANSGIKANESFQNATAAVLADRNKRSVWTVTTEGYKDAHFATFPTKLIEPCILAGTSEKGCCPHCRAPWAKQTGRPCEQCSAFIPTQGKSCAGCGHVRDWKAKRSASAELNATEWSKPGRSVPRNLTANGKQAGVPAQEQLVVGWAPTCDCQAYTPVACEVLDCFGGSGTTGLVADRLGRNALLCELNPAYAAMGDRRIAVDLGHVSRQRGMELGE